MRAATEDLGLTRRTLRLGDIRTRKAALVLALRRAVHMPIALVSCGGSAVGIRGCNAGEILRCDLERGYSMERSDAEIMAFAPLVGVAADAGWDAGDAYEARELLRPVLRSAAELGCLSWALGEALPAELAPLADIGPARPSWGWRASALSSQRGLPT